jgi:heme oxygenase
VRVRALDHVEVVDLRGERRGLSPCTTLLPMTSPSAMLARLEAATREFHTAVDEHWLDLLASGVTYERYKQHLIRVYGFEAPLESALAYTPNLVVADRMDRMRSGLIAQDLLALGVSPAKVTALPHCKVGQFADPAEALGWKYVIERPTQLHASIKRNLVAQLEESANACAYLSAYGNSAAARWQQLGALLDDVSTRHGAADRMTHAAHAAFACLVDWYQHDPSPAVAS